jgi:hypothetical protein
MPTPDNFYSKDDLLDKNSRAVIWKNIKKSITRKSRPGFRYIDTRSFAYGMAAAVVILFSLAGMYSILLNILESKQPDFIKINDAYTTAIDKFEKALPENLLTGKDHTNLDEFISIKQENLDNISTAIFELQKELPKKDFSTIKQKRLRALYSMKLKILEDLILLEKGEI